MALKSTVFKVDLSVADFDRDYFHSASLTVARHPSETDQRMVARVLAYALHIGPGLEFGRGLSTADEPDLWQKDLTGLIQMWVEVGLPDPARIRKACRRSDRVAIYSYGSRSAPVWWQQNGRLVDRYDNLTITEIPVAALGQLAENLERSNDWQCSIQDGVVAVDDGRQTVRVETIKRL